MTVDLEIGVSETVGRPEHREGIGQCPKRVRPSRGRGAGGAGSALARRPDAAVMPASVRLLDRVARLVDAVARPLVRCHLVGRFGIGHSNGLAHDPSSLMPRNRRRVVTGSCHARQDLRDVNPAAAELPQETILIEEMGGTIAAANRAGRGAEFLIVVPAAG